MMYLVLINGELEKIIKPTRGDRQGDPISPYPFILCAGGIISLINSAERKGNLKGVAVSRWGTRLSHLLFSDDSVLSLGGKR